MFFLLDILGLLLIFYWMAKICDEYFVNSLEIISRKLKISEDVTGATFMAVGSSAPELFTAIIALTIVGSAGIGAGTIVGSAIFNILVIVGASATIATAHLKWRPILRDLGFYIISLSILLITFADGVITLNEALIYVIFYGVYLLILANWKRWVPLEPVEDSENLIPETIETPCKNLFCRSLENFTNGLFSLTIPNVRKNPSRYLSTFWISLLYIALLSWVMVELAIHFAHGLHIPEAIIALTILAAGTSVPDLLSSFIASKRGHGGMAVSNAIGSNTFDILIGLGLPWFLYILWKKESIVVGTESLWSSMILLFATVLLVALIIIGHKFNLGKKAGIFLILVYVTYLAFVILKTINPDIFASIL